MKLSIITICYNNSLGLLKTINSLKSQLYKDFEFVVIDGGSQDDSINIIKNNENIITYWLSERDNGIYHAMNKGIEVATGVILTFFINIRWVFQPSELNNFKRKFFKYIIVYLCSYIVNLALLKIGVDLFCFDPFWYQFALIPIVVIINFTGIKYWALR